MDGAEGFIPNHIRVDSNSKDYCKSAQPTILTFITFKFDV